MGKFQKIFFCERKNGKPILRHHPCDIFCTLNSFNLKMIFLAVDLWCCDYDLIKNYDDDAKYYLETGKK